jgi:acetyl-CoA carboxylase biotin carboxyl carrier protein
MMKLSKKTQTKNKSAPKKAAKKTARKVSTGKVGTGPMDISLLEQLTRMMNDADLNTVDLRDGEKRIVLKRGAVQVAAPVYASAPVQQLAPAAVSAAPNTPATTKSTPADDSDAGLVPIKSPMVGTFYSAPSPDAKPFVSVGNQVDEETDVCIIEAMKVFNNIKAETRGSIAKILVTNGQTVEFGQALFLVKPS